MKDNKEQSSNLFPSSLLQTFTKKTAQSQYTLPLHPYRSASKIQSTSQNNNQTFSIHHRQLLSQTSRRKLQLPHVQLQQRYQQIQKILMNQNQNLKQQNQYLASEIRRINKKEKQARHQFQEVTHRNKEQQDQILQLQRDFSQLKGFIQQNIQTLIILLQASSLVQLKNTLSAFIEGLSDILCLENTEKIKIRELSQIRNYEQSDMSSIDKQIQELSDRLQSLIQQNNSSCREPRVRRQCIQIAKQIKQLQNKKKTPRFYKQHEQTASFDDREKSYVPKNARKKVSNHYKKSRLSLKQQNLLKLQSSDDKFKYPKRIYSKVTHRRSGSKETKLLHSHSVNSLVNKKDKH